MKRLLLVSCFALVVSGCGSTDTVPTSTATPTTLAGFHPRCFMAPADRPRPEEHIPCPGSGGDSSMRMPSGSPSPTISIPTSVPTGLLTPVSPSSVARTPTTGRDMSCFTGTWHQSYTEVAAQFRQVARSTPGGLVDGTIDYIFGPGQTFKQVVNHLQFDSFSSNAVTSSETTEIEMNGTAHGMFKQNIDGNLYFYNVTADEVTTSMKVNGQMLMPETNLGGILPTGETQVTASCSGNNMTLSMHFSTGSATIMLTR